MVKCTGKLGGPLATPVRSARIPSLVGNPSRKKQDFPLLSTPRIRQHDPSKFAWTCPEPGIVAFASWRRDRQDHAGNRWQANDSLTWLTQLQVGHFLSN